MVKIVTVDHENDVIRTFMLFTQLAGATIKYIDSKFYRDLRISLIKYMALKVLVINGGIMKHSELARWTNTKKHNITALVDRMKEDQLVTTVRGITDKRVNNIVLTDRGREIYEQANPIARGIVKQLMRGINDKDTRDFERLLDIIKRNIERD